MFTIIVDTFIPDYSLKASREPVSVITLYRYNFITDSTNNETIIESYIDHMFGWEPIDVEIKSMMIEVLAVLAAGPRCGGLVG